MKMLFDPTSVGGRCVLLEGVVRQDSKDKPKEIRLVGRNIMAEEKNVNGRIYPREVIVEAVKELVENWVDKGRSFGELEHPKDYTNINPSESADRLVKLYQDPDNENAWIGESVVLASDPKFGIHGTPKGDILAAILQHGGQVGRSTRGVGDFDEATGVVKPGYRIVCIDSVLDPSGVGCQADMIVEGVLQNRDFMIDEHGVLVESSYDALSKGLSTLPRADRNLYVEQCLARFLSSI